MTEPNYKEMYEQLRDTLNIHHSHDFESVLRYARVAVDRYAVAQQMLNVVSRASTELAELDKRVW